MVWVDAAFSKFLADAEYNSKGYNDWGYDIEGWGKNKVHVTGYNKNEQYVSDWKCCGNKPGSGEYHFVKGNGVPGMNICNDHNHKPCIRDEGGCIPMDGPDLERPRKYVTSPFLDINLVQSTADSHGCVFQTPFTVSVEYQLEHWKKTLAARAKMLPPARPSGSGSGSGSASKSKGKGKERAN